MSIEMYDKAKVIIKDDIKYFLLKYGSKNTFICGGQMITDNDLHHKYISRDVRDSHWSIIAYGSGYMADTYWNAPTGSVYGRIHFGDKKNMAYYMDRVKPIPFEELDAEQQSVFIGLIPTPDNEYVIDLENIPENKKVKYVSDYCGTQERIEDFAKYHNERAYWNLDNL